ncbi:MAG: alkaline phosphatase family protein [Saprospiraceae bacterium]|nr:alkaline phosphatase family protein [Saprospiraceae bacterium]
MRLLSAFALLLLFAANAATAQTAPPSKPKIVVGIVVDQMRYDYLYRYQRHYGPGGFNRLLKGGFSCENTRFNYVPTYTGPGHAAIYTGTTPSLNGIIGNDWWDPELRIKRYCTADKRHRTVGGTAKTDPGTGQHSPVALLSSTITDELRLSNNFRSKVASVCLKDRGSILPAGHIPNACYWFDDASGNWITSTYYPDSLGLPKWVSDYNARRWPDTFLNKTWEMGHAPTESFDNWNYVGKYGSLKGGFPHDFAAARASGSYGVLRFTPYGNTLVTNFAMETIDAMELGADEWTDFLCVSYSATDYCAHQFGVHAQETEDMYVRMDRELSRFFEYLERKFGKDNVLVFLTADHGGAETPVHLNKLHIPAGVFEESTLEDRLEKSLEMIFGTSGNYIQAVENQQIWLNWDALADLDMKPEEVAQAIGGQIRSLPGVYDVLTRHELEMLPAEYPFVSELRRGIHPRRSGDMIYLLDPAWHADDKAFSTGGTTHGSPYPYDTHVPLVWYGWRIQPGESHKIVSITDIAPTLAAMLRIMEPNATTGKIIEELMR